MAVLRIHAPVVGPPERVFEWDGRPITIGRDDTCDVVLLEQAASRHHARLERHGDEIRVIDSESANGVWVGSERVVGSRPLHDGDVIRIGDTTLTLVLDPHHQPTIIRSLGDAAPEPALPSPSVDIGSGATLAASHEPAPAPSAAHVEPTVAVPEPVAAASSTEPALLAPRPQLPPPPAAAPLGASSPSAYSIGSDPTLAGSSGPNFLGIPDRSSPSEYSLGNAATHATDREPLALGRPLASSASVYSLGHEAPAASREPQAFGGHVPSSASVYSLGNEAPARSREPQAFGGHVPSSASVYSLGHEAPARSREPGAMGALLASSSSVYSLGRGNDEEFRGPDTPQLPPAPAFEAVGSSSQLGPAPAPPQSSIRRPIVEAVAPRPPALVAPPSPRSAASSWEWTDPPPPGRHHRSRAAQPILWLGLGLLIGGIVAIIAALAVGYEPSELTSLLGAATPTPATTTSRVSS